MEKNKLQKIADGLGNMKRSASVTLNKGSMIDESNSSLNAIAKGLQKQQAERKAKRLASEALYQQEQEALQEQQALQEQEKADQFE